MKKKLIVLILILGWSISKGQLYPPIQPYNESGYSLLDFDKFSLNPQSDLSESYRDELFSIVVNFLKEIGLYEKYKDDLSIRWIFNPSHTWPEHRVYNGFWNSHQSRDGNRVEWYWDKSHFDGMVMVLHLEGYQLDLAKTICMNLVKVPFITPIIKHEEVKKPNIESLLREYKPSSEIINSSLITTTVKTKTWFGKNWPYLTAGAALITGGIIVGERNDWWRKTSEGSNFNPGGTPVPQGVTFVLFL